MTSKFLWFSLKLALIITAYIVLIALQSVSSRLHKIQERKARVLLYSVYVSGFLCNVFGFSLHTMPHAHWCEATGMIICLSLLGSSKASLFAFFMYRAKMAYAASNSKKWAIFFRYIAPLYVFIYWVGYCILANFAGKGLYVDVGSVDSHTRCEVRRFETWFAATAISIDVFNCIVAIMLFAFPLVKLMRKPYETGDPGAVESRRAIMSVLKWNIVLSSLATTSSVATLVILPYSSHFMTTLCLADPFVNATCTFFMMATNRRFIMSHCTCQKYKDTEKVLATIVSCTSAADTTIVL